jgi:ribulose-5-phosphate 4-epimerase/fuculose-1-phosphate aldolase
MEVLGDADFVLIRKHGFVSLGTTMKEAGERAIETHRLCLQGC